VTAVGHPKVTERAYAQSRDRRDEAARFAESIVQNVFGRHKVYIEPNISSRLMEQIERDYLVTLMQYSPEPTPCP